MSLNTALLDFKENLNPFAFEAPYCTGKTNCDPEHDFIWSSCVTSSLNPLRFTEICCVLVRQAAEYSKVSTDVVLPDGDKTIISCGGNVRAINWEPFNMTPFNDPKPTNALDATLADVCLAMEFNTINRSERLSYGKHSLDSETVLSRHDILNAYETLVGKDVDRMCRGIKSIRIQHFWEERDEFDRPAKVR